MTRPAQGMRMVPILITLLLAVGCAEQNGLMYGTLNEKLGWKLDEDSAVLYMDSVFVPRMDDHEVDQGIAEIGEYQVCYEIVHLYKVETIEIRTGTPAVDEYDYLIWDFVFTREGELVRVSLNSWFLKCPRPE
ncbi:hypothetical protein ACFLWA_10485 [Chloroflexota bacterium]